MGYPTFAVVVPAYNEDETIEECLQRLLTEGSDIDEIIVVDNNSADQTAAVVTRVASSHPTVRLIRESQQGVVFARNAGFDAASADVIARTDADTVIPSGWAKRLRDFFDTEDGSEFDVVSTLGEFRGMPGRKVHRALNKWNAAGRKAGRAQKISYCFGPSMAFRAQTWKRVRSEVSLRRDIFEDVDFALCVEESGGACALIRDVVVEASPRRFYTGMRSYATYSANFPRTYWMHGKRVYAAVLTALLPLAMVFHAVHLAILRGFGEPGSGFSVRRIFAAGGPERVIP